MSVHVALSHFLMNSVIQQMSVKWKHSMWPNSDVLRFSIHLQFISTKSYLKEDKIHSHKKGKLPWKIGLQMMNLLYVKEFSKKLSIDFLFSFILWDTFIPLRRHVKRRFFSELQWGSFFFNLQWISKGGILWNLIFFYFIFVGLNRWDINHTQCTWWDCESEASIDLLSISFVPSIQSLHSKREEIYGFIV